MNPISRRSFVHAGATASFAAFARSYKSPRFAEGNTVPSIAPVNTVTSTRMITIEARPSAITIDPSKTVLLIVDMQNDFGAEGGMLHRSGIDIGTIRGVIKPCAAALAAARGARMMTVYLKMGYLPDLSDLGAAESPNRVRHLAFGVGQVIRAPNATESRILVRDTWNTDILPELAPRPDDTVLYKSRYSGFYKTDLDAVLKRRGVRHLIVAGCTTSICVESTVRDAMFRDYSAVVLSDCVAEPYGRDFSRSNHEASLLIFEALGWVSRSDAFVSAFL